MSCGPCFEFEPSLFKPGGYFYIKYIGKWPRLTNEFQRSMVFETDEFEQPEFDCNWLKVFRQFDTKIECV